MSEKRCVPFKVTIAGREIEAFMKESDWEYVTSSLSPKKTGYERVEQSEEFFYQQGDGYTGYGYDHYNENCSNYFDSANYYSDKDLAENNVRADKLMRQLRRFAVEHRNNKIDWNSNDYKYVIRYGHGTGEITYGWEIKGHEFGSIFFDSEEAVYLAIETFHDELIWYFTEYKDSL